MFYTKYKLTPLDGEEREKRNPFENVYAQKAKAGLIQLQNDAVDGPPKDENARLERQQKLSRYKNNFGTAIEKSRFGTLQETDAEENNSTLEEVFKQFLENRGSRKETTDLLPGREMIDTDIWGSKQKERRARSKTTKPIPTKRTARRQTPRPTTPKRKSLGADNFSPPFLRGARKKQTNREKVEKPWKMIF